MKYVGMSWDMVRKLPIQERRAMIHKHNLDSERIEREIEGKGNDSPNQHLEGEGINMFAERTQNDPLGG